MGLSQMIPIPACGDVILGYEVFGILEGVKEVIVRHLLRTPHPVLPPQGGKGRKEAVVE